MRPRRILGAIVGTVQGLIGVLAVIFAYILYIDFFGLQAWLDVTAEFLPLYMLALIVFGFFSIMSGLFLITERELP
ncbi:MAG: hypothetical protein OEX76_06870 [Candidatus Bathyarchaeota archaeon]|nr:hypothetical protein [Candidatus Bathyarchaeota archaeon]MDH5532638.1 hypothetical protein [Candidatus Bathyarchaeota archaeon]MDH5713200.1 hypothetical protein [Candidatus Bathyarchaeota archaeon]